MSNEPWARPIPPSTAHKHISPSCSQAFLVLQSPRPRKCSTVGTLPASLYSALWRLAVGNKSQQSSNGVTNQIHLLPGGAAPWAVPQVLSFGLRLQGTVQALKYLGNINNGDRLTAFESTSEDATRTWYRNPWSVEELKRRHFLDTQQRLER
ncbi:hypothetical protein PAXRUDRAFT_832431 [Paxillus rubicundulus Ve08.2h10]|uniref:Uncharacterized protein n=1 Tax=Paxillus rubicundulus Ve08.2h10 TaxID=930991 RepID=A0A0D0CH75_9AGAM|nr:hypothetical protein PAXRUDRAFT_832431 [Paxillus rubicundulus Ve08.2h10]